MRFFIGIFFVCLALALVPSRGRTQEHAQDLVDFAGAGEFSIYFPRLGDFIEIRSNIYARSLGVLSPVQETTESSLSEQQYGLNIWDLQDLHAVGVDTQKPVLYTRIHSNVGYLAFGVGEQVTFSNALESRTNLSLFKRFDRGYAFLSRVQSPPGLGESVASGVDFLYLRSKLDFSGRVPFFLMKDSYLAPSEGVTWSLPGFIGGNMRFQSNALRVHAYLGIHGSNQQRMLSRLPVGARTSPYEFYDFLWPGVSAALNVQLRLDVLLEYAQSIQDSWQGQLLIHMLRPMLAMPTSMRKNLNGRLYFAVYSLGPALDDIDMLVGMEFSSRAIAETFAQQLADFWYSYYAKSAEVHQFDLFTLPFVQVQQGGHSWSVGAMENTIIAGTKKPTLTRFVSNLHMAKGGFLNTLPRDTRQLLRTDRTGFFGFVKTHYPIGRTWLERRFPLAVSTGDLISIMGVPDMSPDGKGWHVYMDTIYP